MKRIIFILGAMALLFVTPAWAGGTYTFYPGHDNFLRSQNVSLSTACSGYNPASTSTLVMHCGEQFDALLYNINKAYMWFYVTGIGDGETIATANVILYCSAEPSEAYLGVQMYDIPDYIPFDPTDWDQPSKTLIYTKNAADINAATYAYFPCASYVANNDTLYVMLKTVGQCDPPAPTNDQRVTFRATEYPGTTYDPRLVIVTTGGAATQPRSAYAARKNIGDASGLYMGRTKGPMP